MTTASCWHGGLFPLTQLAVAVVFVVCSSAADVSVVCQGLYKLFMETHQAIIKKFKSRPSDSLTDIAISVSRIHID